MAKFSFDATTVEDTGSALPAGSYTGIVEDADVVSTKAGDGQYILVRTKIDGPTHAGMLVFDRIMIEHPNTIAEEIGRKRLAQLIMASGLPEQIEDTDVFIGKRVGLVLKVTQSGQYGPSNDVTRYIAPDNVKVEPAAEKSAPASKPVDEDMPW